jgi:hypothetical protein
MAAISHGEERGARGPGQYKRQRQREHGEEYRHGHRRAACQHSQDQGRRQRQKIAPAAVLSKTVQRSPGQRQPRRGFEFPDVLGL